MGLIDKALVIADAVALAATGIVGTAINFNYSDIGSGTGLTLQVVSSGTGTGAGAGNSWTYIVRTADASGSLATGTIIGQSDAIPGASHSNGAVVWEFRLPPALCKSRIGLYVTKTGTTTATVSAHVIGRAISNGLGVRPAITAAS